MRRISTCSDSCMSASILCYSVRPFPLLSLYGVPCRIHSTRVHSHAVPADNCDRLRPSVLLSLLGSPCAIATVIAEKGGGGASPPLVLVSLGRRVEGGAPFINTALRL